MPQTPPKAEVIGEGDPFKIRVTMPDGNVSHDVARQQAITRLPEGCWILTEYRLRGVEDEYVVAECHYRRLDVDAQRPLEIVVVGDAEVPRITRVSRAPR